MPKLSPNSLFHDQPAGIRAILIIAIGTAIQNHRENEFLKSLSKLDPPIPRPPGLRNAMSQSTPQEGKEIADAGCDLINQWQTKVNLWPDQPLYSDIHLQAIDQVLAEQVPLVEVYKSTINHYIKNKDHQNALRMLTACLRINHNIHILLPDIYEPLDEDLQHILWDELFTQLSPEDHEDMIAKVQSKIDKKNLKEGKRRKLLRAG